MVKRRSKAQKAQAKKLGESRKKTSSSVTTPSSSSSATSISTDESARREAVWSKIVASGEKKRSERRTKVIKRSGWAAYVKRNYKSMYNRVSKNGSKKKCPSDVMSALGKRWSSKYGKPTKKYRFKQL